MANLWIHRITCELRNTRSLNHCSYSSYRPRTRLEKLHLFLEWFLFGCASNFSILNNMLILFLFFLGQPSNHNAIFFTCLLVCFVAIQPFFSEIKQIKYSNFKFQGQGHGYDQHWWPYLRPNIHWNCLRSHFNFNFFMFVHISFLISWKHSQGPTNAINFLKHCIFIWKSDINDVFN